jgi:hypothetical protein
MMRGSPLQCVLGYEIHARPSCRPVMEVNITSFGDWRRSSIALLVRRTARFAKALFAIRPGLNAGLGAIKACRFPSRGARDISVIAKKNEHSVHGSH